MEKQKAKQKWQQHKKDANIPDYNSSETDFSLEDLENYRSDQMQVFNHQLLVMEILRKATEAGSHELRAGIVNEKVDSNGNVIRQYIEDTREKFINCVKTAINVMVRDFDTEATKNISEIIDELETEEKELIKAQWKWYQELPPDDQLDYKGQVHQLFLNEYLPWNKFYKDLEVKSYRYILQELHCLTKRNHDYQESEHEG